MATLDQSPNPVDISVHISVIHLFSIIHHLSSLPPIIMPIDLSNLSAEDVAAAAVEAARRACEERERREVDDWQRQQEEEHAHQEVTARREAEEQKEAAVWQVEAEWTERLARDKTEQEAAAVEEQWQSLTMGLSGLKPTIPAPASITHMALGSSTQSKGKRKVTEEDLSASQYVSLFIFNSLLTIPVGRGFPRAIHTQSLASPV
jgi:hypothetical protein